MVRPVCSNMLFPARFRVQVTLSTLMHLLRFISQKGLRSAFGRESEARGLPA